VQERKSKLHHNTPAWIASGSWFHIRICADKASCRLTEPPVGHAIRDAAVHYHRTHRWHALLLVLMPDHLHAIMCFPASARMSEVLGAWKGYLAKNQSIRWQDNYFDHRLRNDDERIEKAHYIRMNPVRAGLCQDPKDWPWVLEPSDFADRMS
jgi:putative transposase